MREPPARAAAPHPDLHRRLHAIVGDAGVVDDARLQAPYLSDWLQRRSGRAALVVRPADTAQTAAVMRVCHETHTPVVTQGGNTGLRGGATPDASGAQVILHTGRMNRIRALDPVRHTLVAEAGVRLARVQQAAQEVGRCFPLRLGSEARCTIGGNLATNAGGAAAPRHATLRELALGLEVVLPDGQVWNGLCSRHQDDGGVDLRQLMIGSGGTLGIITAAVLKLRPGPVATATAWVGARHLDALVGLADTVRARCGACLAAFEMMSDEALSLVLAQVPGTHAPLPGRHAFHALIALSDTCAAPLAAQLRAELAEASATGALSGVAVGTTPAQVQAFWRLRRGVTEAQAREGCELLRHEVWLPASRLAAFVAVAGETLQRCAPGARVLSFGPLVDGGLHFDLLLPRPGSTAFGDDGLHALGQAVHALAADHGGSATAEHDVAFPPSAAPRHGQPAIEVDLAMRIKQALDPNHLMNPGKIF